MVYVRGFFPQDPAQPGLWLVDGCVICMYLDFVKVGKESYVICGY